MFAIILNTTQQPAPINVYGLIKVRFVLRGGSFGAPRLLQLHHNQKLSREIAGHENLLKCSANIYLVFSYFIKIAFKNLRNQSARTLNLEYFKI